MPTVDGNPTSRSSQTAADPQALGAAPAVAGRARKDAHLAREALGRREVDGLADA